MKKVITLGGAMLDLFIHHEQLASTAHPRTNVPCLLLEIGRKLEITSLIKQSGGGATNAAVSFARLGFPVQTFFKIGADCEGDFILEELQRENVNVDLASRIVDAITGTSIIIPCPSGERTVLAYRGANITIEEQELPIKKLDCCDALYITSLTGSTASLLLPITRHAKKQGKIVATNPGTSQLIQGTQILLESLSHIDIFVLNSFEAQACMRAFKKQKLEKTVIEEPASLMHAHMQKTNLPALLCEQSEYHKPDFNLRIFCKEILSRGPQVIAVTNGKEGVYVAQGDTLYFHPSFSDTVVSTVGAGDAFGSCFVASLLEEKSVPEALIRGIINASSVIGYVGAKTGLLTRDALEKRFQEVGLNQLQTYTF
jgi:sugar/nucleoside kinase (ribokinase family)